VGQLKGVMDVPARDTAAYLNHPLAMVAHPTPANDIPEIWARALAISCGTVEKPTDDQYLVVLCQYDCCSSLDWWGDQSDYPHSRPGAGDCYRQEGVERGRKWLT